MFYKFVNKSGDTNFFYSDDDIEKQVSFIEKQLDGGGVYKCTHIGDFDLNSSTASVKWKDHRQLELFK